MGITPQPPRLFCDFSLSTPEMTLSATTELEAVNALLATIGESPVASVDLNHLDTAMAVNALRSAQRAVCSERWRFNTEFGYTIASHGTYSGLHVFQVPTDLAGFDLSRTPAQASMDVIIRKPVQSPTPAYGAGRMVFYDRLNAREGFSVSSLRIDPVWMIDYEYCPQPARHLIWTMAARRFQAQVKGSQILHAITEADEQAARAALEADQRLAAPPVPSGTAETERDALNQILTAAGVDPVISTDALLGREASNALNILRSCTREVCSKGWRFNTEFGLEIAPSDEWEWEDRLGETHTLNIFTPPANLLSFDVTAIPEQQGQNYLSTAIRRSQEYTSEGEPVDVFYDRNRNLDGHERYFLYINPVWLLSFEELPEEARKYVSILASRRFAKAASPYTERDEATAYRDLKTNYKKNDDTPNIFDNISGRRGLGRRPVGLSGWIDGRASVGGAE